MNTPSKHPRDDKDDSDDVQFVKMIKRGELSSLSGFRTLLDEVKITILAHAGRFGSQAALNLMLVSRFFHETVKPWLCRHVKLDRPSKLAEFGQALRLQPDKGALVESLHIGPLSDLPEGLWPRRFVEKSGRSNGHYLTLVKTSLSEREEALLPCWCKPGREWACESSKKARDCQDRAVADAIKAALDGVNIYLGHPEESDHDYCEADGCGIGQNEWTVGLIYMQAILDLYLCEMRRLEDVERRPVQSWRSSPAFDPSTSSKKSKESGDAMPNAAKDCIAGKCGHYPRLLLKGFNGCRPKPYMSPRTARKEEQAAAAQGGWGNKKPNQGQNVFLITRDQVKKHLNRRNSPTDHFEHPLFFTRRDLWMLNDDLDTVTVKYDYNVDNRDRRYHYEDLYDSDGEFMDNPSAVPISRSSDDDADVTKRNGVAALAHQVLLGTGNLVNLALTGFLYESLQEDLPVLAQLRCLSLASPHRPATNGRFLQDLDLPKVEKLRFCADYFDVTVAKHIGGFAGEWPSLRQVEWDFADSRLRLGQGIPDLLSIINALQGTEGDLSSSQAAANVRNQADPGANTVASPATATAPECYVEARLHPAFISSLLAEARPEVRAAWLDGSPLEGARNRVRIVESKAVRALEGKHYEPRQDYQAHRKECEKWWEQCACELENGGKLSFT